MSYFSLPEPYKWETFLFFCRSVRKGYYCFIILVLELEDTELKYMQFPYDCLFFKVLIFACCFILWYFPSFPECSLRLYGSSLTKFALKSSDVNIDIKFPPKVSN